MHPGPGRFRPPLPPSRVLLTALLVTVAVGSAVPARAAPAAVRTSTGWRLSVNPRRSAKFCVGEKQEYFVGISQAVSREVNGFRYTSSQSLSGATILAQLTDDRVATVSVPQGTTATMMGGSYQTRYVFTARRPGNTTLIFKGFLPNETVVQPAGTGDDLAPLTPPDVEVSIPIRVVRCKYRLSIYGGWTHPGERDLVIKGTIRDAILEPDDDGNFTAQATMENSGVWYGLCTGQSDIADPVVSITGSVRDGTLQASVEYPVVSSTTTEGCVGKSVTGTGYLDRLDLTMAASTGATTRLQILHIDQDLPGTSVITLIAEEVQAVALRYPQAALASLPAWSRWFASWGGG